VAPNFRICILCSVPQNTSVYVDCGGTSSSATGFDTLVSDAAAHAPSGTDFSNLRAV
jgi:hypothetical protein